MKKLLIILVTTFTLSATINAQTWRIENLYQTYKGEKGVVALTIPGFLCRMAANIAGDEISAEEEELLYSIRSIRVLTIEDNERFKNVNFVKEARMTDGKKGYDMLVQVSEKDEDVMILGKTRRGKLRNLLVIVGGEENVLVHIKGRLNADMLGSIAKIANIENVEVLSQM